LNRAARRIFAMFERMLWEAILLHIFRRFFLTRRPF
jgi:hypothetical protein